jgi:hypothetical protein
MQCYKYNEAVTIVTGSLIYDLTPRCNGYVAVNIGDTIAIVNQKRLLPAPGPGLSGESAGVQGNLGEIFTGTNGSIPVFFGTPLGVNPKVMIIEKFYVEEP